MSATFWYQTQFKKKKLLLLCSISIENTLNSFFIFHNEHITFDIKGHVIEIGP